MNTTLEAAIQNQSAADTGGYDLMRLTTDTYKYALPPIIVVGTVGNVLSFVVLVKRPMRRKSVYFYLLLLAIADTIVLYTNGFRSWYRVTFGKELYLHHSGAVCRLHNFVFEVFSHMSAWLIVLVTVDRWIAVTFPLRAATICTGRRAAIISSVCFLVISVYKIHIFWTYELHVFKTGDPVCAPYRSNFMHSGYNYMNFATYCIVPFLVILVFNFKIVKKMKRNHFGESGSGSGNGNARLNPAQASRMSRTAHADRESDIARMTTVLYLVSFTWFVLTFPFALFQVLPRQSSFAYIFPRVICFILLNVNHAINFYLYCLSGKKLRKLIYAQLRGDSFNKKFSTLGKAIVRMRGLENHLVQSREL